MTRLQKYGNTALITGASSGIGEAFAEALAKEKINLILVARREERLQKIATKLQKEFGISVEILVQDLSQAEAGKKVYETVHQKGLHVDILVNNAGFGSHGRFQELDLETELSMVDLNCRLPVELTHRFLPQMQQQGKGAIIILSSVLGKIPAPYMSTYAATKAFDLFFAEGLYGELKGTGIDVLAVLPGYTETGFQEAAGITEEISMPTRTSADVVESSFRALGKQASVVDGFLNKTMIGFTNMTPRSVLISTNAKMMKVR